MDPNTLPIPVPYNKPIFQTEESPSKTVSQADFDKLKEKLVEDPKRTDELIGDTNVVLYRNSFYGFSGAFITWVFFEHYFPKEKRGTVQYICYEYEESNKQFSKSFLDEMTGKNLLICDFPFGRETFISLADVVKSVQVIANYEDQSFLPESMDPYIKSLTRISSISNAFYLLCQIVGPTGQGPDESYKNSYRKTLELAAPKLVSLISKGYDLEVDYRKSTRLVPKTVNDTVSRDAARFYAYMKRQPRDFSVWYQMLLADQDQISQAIVNGEHQLEYQKLVVDKMVRNVVHVFYMINGELQLSVQCNAPILKDAVCRKLLMNHPLADFALVWYQKDHKTVRTVLSREKGSNNDIVAKSSELQDNTTVPGCLNFEVRSLSHLIEMLNSYETVSHTNKNIERGCVRLFKTTSMEWVTSDIVAFIKKKFDRYTYLAIQTPSEMVDYDRETGTLVPQTDCAVIFNELTLPQAEAKKYLETKGANNYITFTCSKDIREVLKLLIPK